METKGGEIFRLIPQVMKVVGAVEKGRRNQQQGYAFRGIDDLYNAMQQPMAEAGIFCVPSVVERHREERTTKNGGVLIYTVLRVKHTFYAPDGSSVESVTEGEAMDSGDKSSNKAMSAAMKYALIEVFCIPTADAKDTENDTPAVAPRQRPQPRQAPPPRAPQQKPNGNGDALANNERFLTAVDEAFQNKEFPPSAIDKVLAKVLHAKGKTRLVELNTEERHGFIDAIGSGRFDNYKPAPVAAGQ